MKTISEWIEECEWDISIDSLQKEQLEKYTQILLEWNQKFNLTAITDPQGIIVKHYLDSISLLQYAPPALHSRLLDVGSGAGFPGMVLKILRPDIELFCMDGTQKRVNFLNALVEELKLEGVTNLHLRAEEAGHMQELRESFSYVTARAVARLPMLCEYCLPFVEKGGKFTAMKGPDGKAEAYEARKAIYRLGGKQADLFTFSLPSVDFDRTLIPIEKIRETPNAYPRSKGKIKKEPL